MKFLRGLRSRSIAPQTASRRHTAPNRKCNQRGSQVVEFALVFPVFALLTVGVVDYGRFMHARSAMENAAHDSVRWASIHGSDSDAPATVNSLEAYVHSNLIGLDISALTITPTWSPNNAPGSEITVELTYQVSPVMSIIPDNLMVIRSRSRTRIRG